MITKRIGKDLISMRVRRRVLLMMMMRGWRSINLVVDLLSDQVDAEGDEGDAKPWSGVPELVSKHRVLPPLVPSPEEFPCWSKWFSHSLYFLSFCSASLSLLSDYKWEVVLNKTPCFSSSKHPFFKLHLYPWMVLNYSVTTRNSEIAFPMCSIVLFLFKE